MLEVRGRKGLKIYFDEDRPEDLLDDISLFGMSKKQLKEALKKPFIVTDDLNVLIEYKNEKHFFTIPKGYTWNGANVPPFAWLLIGQRTDPRFKLASCLHDYLCEHHEKIGNNRYLSTLVFETLCNHFGKFNALKRWAMFHSVDNFQKVAGKDLNRKKWGNK
jgi:hypothetical protein|nr:MAG TPA: Protein of unknown function (DUF1353) [Caudoviricetes sp.]